MEQRGAAGDDDGRLMRYSRFHDRRCLPQDYWFVMRWSRGHGSLSAFFQYPRVKSRPFVTQDWRDQFEETLFGPAASAKVRRGPSSGGTQQAKR